MCFVRFTRGRGRGGGGRGAAGRSVHREGGNVREHGGARADGARGRHRARHGSRGLENHPRTL